MEKQWPLVSVCILSFNRLDYLKSCIEKNNSLYSNGSINIDIRDRAIENLSSRIDEIQYLISQSEFYIRESYYYKNIDSEKNRETIREKYPITVKIGDSKFFNLNEDSVKAINQFFEDNKNNIV